MRVMHPRQTSEAKAARLLHHLNPNCDYFTLAPSLIPDKIKKGKKHKSIKTKDKIVQHSVSNTGDLTLHGNQAQVLSDSGTWHIRLVDKAPLELITPTHSNPTSHHEVITGEGNVYQDNIVPMPDSVPGKPGQITPPPNTVLTTLEKWHPEDQQAEGEETLDAVAPDEACGLLPLIPYGEMHPPVTTNTVETAATTLVRKCRELYFHFPELALITAYDLVMTLDKILNMVNPLWSRNHRLATTAIADNIWEATLAGLTHQTDQLMSLNLDMANQRLAAMLKKVNNIFSAKIHNWSAEQLSLSLN